MTALYEKYKGQGVEFIGVSLDAELDDRPLEKLKSVVAAHAMTWPQFYLDRGYDHGVARYWGVGTLPEVFLVDADGKLATTDAAKELETLLPMCLARAKSP
jgi:hypothetical protein